MKSFKAINRIRLGRYFSSIFLIIGFGIILPIWSKGIGVLPTFWSSLFGGPLNIFLTLLFPAILQLQSNVMLRKHVKKMILKDDKIILELFGIIRKKIFEISYKEILSIEYSSDEEKNFVIKMKNGEDKIIYAQVKDKEEAFDLIQEKIK